MNLLKQYLKKTEFYTIWTDYKKKRNLKREEKKIIDDWKQKGRPAPPPQTFKQQVIRSYAKKFKSKVFVETGTYMGDTVEYSKSLFQSIYSIELDAKLFENAKNKFKSDPHVSIIYGDSGERIQEILINIDKSILFWLDGHYSEGFTAKGTLNTPIISELNHILNRSISNQVILIDDARCFNGTEDYPSVDQIKELVRSYDPSLKCYVEHDIIRIYQ